MSTASHKPRYTSRITREMNRESNRSMFSIASSTGSNHGTVSPDSTQNDFDPEGDEAIMSTRQLDHDLQNKLPEIRDTAKKYGRWAPRSQQDFVINTSAIGRAFPDFTQGSSSEDTMSFEVSRGAKSRSKGVPGRTARAEYSGDMDSPIVTIGNIQITGTPRRGKHSKLQEALRNSSLGGTSAKRAASQKENVPPGSDTPVKGSPYVSHASRTVNGERKSLAELHAKVADDPDASYLGAERPVPAVINPKNTRFSSGQYRIPQPAPVSSARKSHYGDAIAEAIRNASDTPSKPPSVQPRRQSQNSSNLTTLNPTQQSFLLPNHMADASINVSGTLSSARPVFTRDGKAASRFSSAQYSRTGSHGPIDGIPLPDDEEDIYLSLEIMKERVAQLEMEKAESRRLVDDLQQNKYQLEAENKELQRGRRADSALGMVESGSDAEASRNSKSLVLEKAKLEANIMTLQDRLEASENQISNLELRLRTNTGERDAAVRQLAKAIHDTEQLELDNESLRNENEALRKQLNEFVTEGQSASTEWQKKETALRTRIQRQDEVVRDMQDMTQELKVIFETTRQVNMAMTTNEQNSASRRVSQVKGKSELTREHDLASKVMELAEKHVKEIKAANAEVGSTRGRDIRSVTSEVKKPKQQRTTSRSHSRRNYEEPSQNDQVHSIRGDNRSQQGRNSRAGSRGPNDQSDTPPGKSKDTRDEGDSDLSGSDYASIVGDGFMNGMRQTLRDAREFKRDHLEAIDNTFAQDDTVQTLKSSHSAHAPSVKGILKTTTDQGQEDLTGRLSVRSIKSNVEIQDDVTAQSEKSHHRHHSDSAAQGHYSRPLAKDDDMTSAFIIPDIVNVTQGTRGHPVLSANARRVLDGLCLHESNNCTICTRVASFDNKRGIKVALKQKVLIEKPIPVSERMPDPAPYEDEPTIRPAVEPGLALASVIKGLQDEVAHLKLKHAEVLEIYNKHDASLGLRRRRSLNRHLEQLAKSIEVKSDQIYALFDVLEGQKQSGQEMNDREVELTLLSIGVAPEIMTKVSQQKTPKKTSRKGDDGLDDEDSELDLPWEGIEDTTHSTSGMKGRNAFEV